MLPADSYSYISNNESAGTSWLDHILCSSPSIINNCAILYGYTFEDHIPINCEIRSPILPECTQSSEGDMSFVQSSFGEILDELVGGFTNFGISCNGGFCNNVVHRDHIEATYIPIFHCINDASSETLPMAMTSKKYRVVPGWDDVKNCMVKPESVRLAYRW